MKKIFNTSIIPIQMMSLLLTLMLCVGCADRINYEKERKRDIATPTFNPKGGTYYKSQKVSIYCATQGATILYTTDGSDPTSSSTSYSTPVSVQQNTTLKAKAFKSGWLDSETGKAEYNLQASTPTFNPPGGSYSTIQSVTISCPTDGATIHYTIDGTDPTSSSTAYSSPINVNQNTTLKAKAFKTGWFESSITTATYTMNVANPSFSIPGGTYNNAQTVSISCVTDGAFIYYTTDGTDPTSTSTAYSSPIIVNQNITLKAKAFKTGWHDSSIITATYTMTVANPLFSIPGGTYNNAQTVSISCATDGSIICYTTNGGDPSSSSTSYSSPISVTENTTLKAKAYKTGWSDSKIVSAEYQFQTAAPTFNPPGGTYKTAQNVSISCVTDGATIRYTTNGSDPTSTSPAYSSPIIVNQNITLKAKAFKSGWNDSPVASASYHISLIEMIRVPGGTFTMGRTKGSGYSDELPTHSVTLNSFYIGKYLVTQSEYAVVMGSNPASGYGVGDNYPVYYVSWYSAIKFCNLLSMLEGLTPVYSISGSTNPANWGEVPTSNNSTWNAAVCNWNANGYRLPTEAEWEYAARGGTNNPDYLYSGSDNIDDVAWYRSNNSPNGTKPIGGKSPNGLDIYDMSGNLYEWCWDWYGESYYKNSPSSNPKGPESGSSRLLRGGGWSRHAVRCRVAYRSSSSPYSSIDDIGFRLCRAAQ